VYVQLADLRAMKELSNPASYSDETLIRAASIAQEIINGFTGTAFEPTPFDVRVNGNARRILYIAVPDLYSIDSVTIDNEELDTESVNTLTGGRIMRFDGGVFTRGVENVRVQGEYGHATTPSDIIGAARWIAWDYALSTTRRLPAGASLITRDEGQVQFQPHEPEAGRAGRATRNPEVNEVLRRRSVSPFMSGGWYA
jgi:hypothetical protein